MSPLIILYITVTEVLVIFNEADTRIKGVQIEDHEIKQQVLPMTYSYSLKEITCLTRIQVILKLKEASSSKTNFSKSQALQDVSYKKK